MDVQTVKKFPARSFPEASSSVKTGLRVDKRTNCEAKIRCPHMCGQRLCSFGKLHFTLWMYNLISYFSISETNFVKLCLCVCLQKAYQWICLTLLHVHSMEQIYLEKLSKKHLDCWDLVRKRSRLRWSQKLLSRRRNTAVTQTFSLWLCVTQGTQRTSASAPRTLQTTLLGQVSARPETIITVIVLLCLLCCG